MKIEINYADQYKVLYPPEGANLVGVTAICDGVAFSVLNPIKKDDLSSKCEEIIFDENCKVIIRYFNSPSVAEILNELSSFEGMKYIEIKNASLNLSVCV